MTLSGLESSLFTYEEKRYILNTAIADRHFQPRFFFKNMIGRISFFSKTTVTSTLGKTKLLAYEDKLEKIKLGHASGVVLTF